MLLRGQNLVGYRHYPDDVVDEFVRLAVKNGIDVFRVFDALNDTRNMVPAIKAVKKYGAHVQGTICYTTSPVHSNKVFGAMAVELENLGCDSICIKDMAGLISPAVARDLVKLIKRKVHVPLDLHSHCSSGMAPLSYYAAALAGVDILDTAFSAFAWGTSQPPTESIAANTPSPQAWTWAPLRDQAFAAISQKMPAAPDSGSHRANINVLLLRCRRHALQPGKSA
jgi:pyruvate carboxylase subunit B